MMDFWGLRFTWLDCKGKFEAKDMIITHLGIY